MKTIKVLEAIAELNLDPIKTKLMHKASGEGWSRARADAIALEYRRFLYLMHTYPNEQIAPTVDVDLFWHYHILDTAKYAADCEQAFGYFLHHYPYVGLDTAEEHGAEERGGNRMRELYEQTFGEEYIRPGVYGSAALDGAEAAYCMKHAPQQAQGAQAAYCMKHAPSYQDGASAAYCMKHEPQPRTSSNAAYCMKHKRMQSAGSAAAYCMKHGPARPSGSDIAYCMKHEPAHQASSDTAYCMKHAPIALTGSQTAYCMKHAPRTASPRAATPVVPV